MRCTAHTPNFGVDRAGVDLVELYLMYFKDIDTRHVLVWITPAYQPRLAGIARYARENGWHLTILDRIARRPVGWSGDGALVTMRDNPEQIEFVESLSRNKTPVVDLTYNHPELRVPRVSGDHEAIGRIAREYFESRHYRNFAWFSTTWQNVHKLRYDGFSVKGGASGAESVARWVLSEEAPPDRLDDFGWFDKWLGAKIKAAPKPLAVLAYDDADAARVLEACVAVNVSVPEEVAILGIGGDRLICESQVVPLSSVEHDQGRTGYEGAKLLDALMRGGKAPTSPILIPPRRITERASTDFTATASPYVQKALAYIRANLGKSFGLEQLAESVGVSRSTLVRIFAKEVGRSPGEEIMRERVEFAKKLMSTGSYSMAEVAFKAGFCNPPYFSNIFKRLVGETPLEWTRKAGP